MATIPQDSVIQFSEAAYSPTGSGVTSANELLGTVINSGLLRPEFLNEGVVSRVLAPGGQWQNGRVRIAIEFITETTQPASPFPTTP